MGGIRGISFDVGICNDVLGDTTYCFSDESEIVLRMKDSYVKGTVCGIDLTSIKIHGIKSCHGFFDDTVRTYWVQVKDIIEIVFTD